MWQSPQLTHILQEGETPAEVLGSQVLAWPSLSRTSRGSQLSEERSIFSALRHMARMAGAAPGMLAFAAASTTQQVGASPCQGRSVAGIPRGRGWCLCMIMAGTTLPRL
jgi:hypothetical protein